MDFAILFGCLFGLLILGVPIGVCLGCGTLAVMIFTTDLSSVLLAQSCFTGLDSFTLLAIPFFVVAGSFMMYGGISRRLLNIADAFLGRKYGGLALVTVVACMFFAAISGSGAATTAAVGATLVPELKKRGYREDSAAALVAAAGTIGVVIPPSVPMVLYAVIAEESVSRLFSAGFLPGVIMGMMLIAIALYQAYQNNYPKGAPFSLKNVSKTFLKAIPGILMPAIILGGIFSGYFTPSEAAAVAVVYALLVSTFVYRDMSLKKLYTTMLGSAKTSAVIMIIIACSGPFGWALANWKIPEAISSAVLSVSTNKYVILFLISLIILVAGVFMETSSAIIILTPVFLPLVRALGISTLHFGILFVVGIAIGMITPPVAINLFVASGITGLSLEKISKAVVPYLIGLIVVFLAIVYLPLFIPGFIG